MTNIGCIDVECPTLVPSILFVRENKNKRLLIQVHNVLDSIKNTIDIQNVILTILDLPQTLDKLCKVGITYVVYLAN